MHYTFENVVIDDERTFESLEGVLYLRTSAEALAALSAIKTSYDYVTNLWLDHDLGMPKGREDNTMVIVDYLCELAYEKDRYPVDHIYIHTQNPPAALVMMRALTRWEYNAKRVPLPD